MAGRKYPLENLIFFQNGAQKGFLSRLIKYHHSYSFLTLSPHFSIYLQWLPDGDAFIISDLQRLESETLPTYFRHRRFQSLVRQLNFYNFRKINKERNFWVYKHPLFHRDRPEDLGMLRRRNCSGVDGRKVRPEVELSNLEADIRSPACVDSDSSDFIPVATKKRKKHQVLKRSDSDSSIDGYETEFSVPVLKSSTPSFMISHAATRTSPESKRQRVDLTDATAMSSTPYLMKSTTRLISPSPSGKGKLSTLEQSHLVNRVAQKLEQHIKRATSKKVRKSGGIVTPPYDAKDTLKYHALTYDDEVEIFDTERGCIVERTDAHGNYRTVADDVSVSSAIVSLDTNEDAEFNHSKKANAVIVDSTPPVDDDKVIYQVGLKILEHKIEMDGIRDATVTSLIAVFCMKTNPYDPSLAEKLIQDMSAHDCLSYEFCSYQAALSPDSRLSEVDQRALLLKQLFQSDRAEIVRIFKTWSLNKLAAIMNLSKCECWDESEYISKCYNTWFAGVALNA